MPTCDLLLSLGMWIYVLSFIVEWGFCFLRHLLSIVVLEMTLKSSSIKRRVVIISLFLWVRNLSDSAGLFWWKVSYEVAVKMLARAAVIWRPDWGWRTHYQNGSLAWLLVGGLSCSPCGPLLRSLLCLHNRAAGSPQREWWEREGERAEEEEEATMPFMT